MLFRYFVPALTATAAVMAATFPATSQDKVIELKIAHWVPTSSPTHQAIEDWALSVEQASGGSLKFKIYPAQQLGKAFDHYDMVRDGIADMVYINPGYQPGRFPIIAAGELPFLVSNAKGGSQALDAWYRKYAGQEMKDVKFCLAFFHDPGSFHSRTKKVVVPADIKGMKIRPGNATMAQFVSLLGGTNVQSSAGEVRDLIEKGVADAVTFPWGSIPLFGIDKVTKYHADMALYASAFAYVFNPATYNRMSKAQQKVIDDHCTNEWALRVASGWADYERAGLPKLQADSAHEVYPLTAEQLAEWKKASEPLLKTWADSIKTGNSDTIMKELKDLLAKFNAAY